MTDWSESLSFHSDLTFAHSGTVVNDKGSDIFVISHFDSLFVVISLNLVVYRHKCDLWNDKGLFCGGKRPFRTRSVTRRVPTIFFWIGTFEVFGFDVVFYEHGFLSHFKWQYKRFFSSAGKAITDKSQTLIVNRNRKNFRLFMTHSIMNSKFGIVDPLF